MILASWFVPLLSADLGWNNGLKLTGGMGITAAVLCFMLLKDKATERRPLNLREIPVDRKEFWTLSFMQFIRLGSYYTFIAWMPLVLREDYGFSVIATSAAMSTLNLAGMLANPIGGLVSDRLGEQRVLYGGFLLLGALIFTLALQPVGIFLYVLIFLLGWFINFTRSPSFTIIPRLFGTNSAGSISGINNTFASFGAFTLPLLLGYIRDFTRSYQVGWITLAALSLSSSILMYFMRTDA